MLKIIKKKIRKSFDVTMLVRKTFKFVLAFMHMLNSHQFLCTNTSKSLLHRDGLKYVSKHSDKTIYKSLNELLLESERSEMKRYVSGHLI